MAQNPAFLFPAPAHHGPSLIGIWLRAIAVATITTLTSTQINGADITSLAIIGAATGLTTLLWQWYARYRSLLGLLQRTIGHWHQGRKLHHPLTPATGLTELIAQLHQALEQSLDTHRMHMHLRMQLAASQHSLGEYQLLASMHGDMKPLFSRVSSYSQMLEETLAHHAAASDLRSCFDELSEQSFNLQLLVAAFEQVRTTRSATYAPGMVNPAQTLSRILVPLAECLDRRAMCLSSAAWDERTYAHIAADELELIAWLILLGTVRYAEDESTLLLSCEPSTSGAHTLITCLVSELAPAAMSPHERADFMDAKAKYKSAHMFAHTLAASTNIVMATRLSERAGGTLSIHPRSHTSCLIELILPRQY